MLWKEYRTVDRKNGSRYKKLNKRTNNAEIISIHI